ncbi:hypothetical protein EBT31_05870 [bacterium]|jgi:hypothetical protein|nr:hypothetical protein [bacterium]
MEIEIDPKTREPVWIFPFEGMSVGDSFFIPTLQTANMLYVVDTRAKVAGLRVKAFAVIENGYLGVRVWRIR